MTEAGGGPRSADRAPSDVPLKRGLFGSKNDTGIGRADGRARAVEVSGDDGATRPRYAYAWVDRGGRWSVVRKDSSTKLH